MATKLIQSQQSHGVRVIAGRVTVSGGTPAVTAGEGFSLTDTGAGQVTVTLSNPGKVTLAAVATPIEGTDATAHMVKVDGITNAESVLFGIYVADATDGALADNVSFSFIIVVSDVD